MKYIPFSLSILVAIILLLSSCKNEDKIIGYIDYEPRIVVEGSIENGQPAMVALSWSAPFNQKMDTAFLLEHVIRSAKVSVSNGKETEVLALGALWNYLPPYIYYGTELKGEVGESYQLTIEYQNKVIRSETSIPEPTPLLSYSFIKENPSDTTGYIRIVFKNTSDLYYQVATRVYEKESVYTPSLYGNIRADQFKKDEIVTLQISKAPVLYPEMQIATYFIEGDIIYLKFRTMPKHGYDFWCSWQNEVVNGQNPIFPSTASLESNIQGGIGIWCGYGSYIYRLDTK